MNFNMGSIKEKFSNFLSEAKIFFSNNKKTIMIILPIIVFTISVSIMLLVLITKKSTRDDYQAKEQSEIKIESLNMNSRFKKLRPNSLWLLDEPLKLPPIQFSREQRRIWKQDEVNYWYEPPNEKAMEELRRKNRKIIDGLLEDAP